MKRGWLNHVAQAETLVARTNARSSQAAALFLRARLALRHGGDPNVAVALFRQALAIRQKYGSVAAQIEAVEGVAGALQIAQAGDRQDAANAVALFAFADAARQRLGMPVPPVARPERAVIQAKLARGISGNDLSAAARRGAELSFVEAAALAAG